MKVKFGSIVVAGRGKIGGHVASANRSGSYFRTKVTPVNPRTAAQSLVRARLTQLSQGWKNLDQAQRDGFNNAVSQFAKTDIFGDLRNPSGANLYQKLNNQLLSIGADAIEDVPQPVAVDSKQLVSAVVNLTGAVGTVSLADVTDATVLMKVFATPALSQGINFVLSEYRLIGNYDMSASAVADVYADYIQKFGSPAEGSKVFFKVQFVNFVTGQVSSQQSISTTVLNQV